MTAKTTGILYWVFTSIFALLMIFSSIDGLGPSDQSMAILHDVMGYPVYFIQFISVAKIIGCLAILIPGIPKTLKEWAYAGLFFDLAGAIYSGVASAGAFDVRMLMMLLWIVPGVLSYYYWHKKINATK